MYRFVLLGFALSIADNNQKWSLTVLCTLPSTENLTLISPSSWIRLTTPGCITPIVIGWKNLAWSPNRNVPLGVSISLITCVGGHLSLGTSTIAIHGDVRIFADQLSNGVESTHKTFS